MPFNGSGGTSQPSSSIYPASANTLIESAKFNISIADIYTMLASCIVKDGQTTTTAAVPFASGIKTDDINENTVGDGVTIDGALIKDGRIDTTQGADIVCAATINLETATGNVVDVTGSTGPVTAITLSQGHWRLVRFTSTPTLTHSATLVLPTAADYTCVAGDYILFVGYASSVVRAYILPTSGPIPYVDSQPVVVGSADKTKKIRFEVDGLTTDTTRTLTVPDASGTLVLSGTKTPTRQVFTSGSGTYTTPAGATRINVRMVGGGGGGGGSGTANNTAGGNGGNTTFSTFTAAGGVGGSTGTGAVVGTGGAGGAPAGSPDIGISGGDGGMAIISTGGLNANQSGGLGGISIFGGSGLSTTSTGVAGKTNSGGGASGGAGTTSTFPAGGGGAGAYVETAITTPAASYSYAVGAAGTAGAIGTSGNAGAAGGSGLVIVDEFYT